MRILFISHDALRTGAPIVLLHFLKWLKEHKDYHLTILLKSGGELEKDFQKLGPTYVWNRDSPRGLFTKIKRKILDENIFYKKSILKKLSKHKPQLIYANTIVSSDLAVELKGLFNCPVICHIHELELAIKRYFNRDLFLRIKDKIDYFIVVSEAVKKNMEQRYQISADKLEKVYAFIPAKEYSQIASSKAVIKNELGIPEDAFIVGASGTTDWRKSPDLFIQVARLVLLKAKTQPVYFIWVGGKNAGIQYEELYHDIIKSGIQNNVFFLGAKSNPLDYFNLMDVFVLTSREDPFPLVCLEAASLAKPIICFKGSGGMQEFIEDDCGFVVPYLDIEAMADKVIELINDSALRKKIGTRSSQKVMERHDIELSAKQIISVLDQFV